MAQEHCIPTEPDPNSVPCYVTSNGTTYNYIYICIYTSPTAHPESHILHLWEMKFIQQKTSKTLFFLLFSKTSGPKTPKRHLWVVNASAMLRLRDYSWPHVPLVPPWPSPVRTVARWSGPGGSPKAVN